MNYDFIKQIIPEMDQKYFAAVTDFDIEEPGMIMKELSAYGEPGKELRPYEQLRLTGNSGEE